MQDAATALRHEVARSELAYAGRRSEKARRSDDGRAWKVLAGTLGQTDSQGDNVASQRLCRILTKFIPNTRRAFAHENARQYWRSAGSQ
jgi:hypothetical protein